jgi:homeodomain-containing protein
MKLIFPATPIALTPEERQALEALPASRKSEARCAIGHGSCCWLLLAWCLARLAARWLHTRPGLQMAVRFAREGLAGLSETGDRGNDRKYGPEQRRRILALLDRPPPAGYANWTAPLLARELVDIHEQYIWRLLRTQKIDLSGGKFWCKSTAPILCPRRLISLAFTWPLRSMPWCFRSMKSHRSRRWSGLKDT